MKNRLTKTTAALLALALASALPSRAAIIISEVNPAGSSSAYTADWFEVTNTGASAVNISGWKIDDNSNSSTAAVLLRGVTDLQAGQSVVFFEGTASGSTDATIAANFQTAWFGSNVPSGFTIGSYGGSGVGLSATADAVNLYDSTNLLIANVSFGATTAGKTFDNAAGLNGSALSTTSAVGVNGGFTSANGNEIGSPGAVPEPASAMLLGLGATTYLFRRRRRA